MKHHARTFACVITALAIGLIVAACGSSKSKSGSGGSSSASSSAASASASASTSASSSSGGSTTKSKLIVIDVPPLSNPFFAAEAKFASAEAKKLGYTTLVLDNNSDPNTQANQIDEAISRHAAAIILDNASATASVAAIQKAKSAGVPTFLIDREINKAGVAVAQLVSNNYSGAELGGAEFAKLMHDSGQYAEIYGLPTDTNAQTRSDGYHAVLNQIKGLHMVARQTGNWLQTTAFQVTQTILQAHPHIKGIISGNDTMALGIEAALKQAHKTNVIVTGMDGSPQAMQSIESGGMDATVLQPVALFSKRAVIEANAYIKHGTKPAQEKQLYTCYLITKPLAPKVHDFVYAAEK